MVLCVGGAGGGRRWGSWGARVEIRGEREFAGELASSVSVFFFPVLFCVVGSLAAATTEYK